MAVVEKWPLVEVRLYKENILKVLQNVKNFLLTWFPIAKMISKVFNEYRTDGKFVNLEQKEPESLH